ncbi:hypothetical protein [Flaviflagellibacter deserti]|uniref:Uncharacterized protein n=1 Tax=Flaviflagellibacter deserti TaxID=2267266 RepID=A0ABV9YY27_9HYPH
MKRFLLLAGSAMIFAVAQFGTADAQPRTAEGDCRAMSGTYGPSKIWWGRFSGARQSPIFDGNELRTSERCFAARPACDRWLYELKSEFQEMPRYNECRLGYAPGAPVAPWWAPKKPRG